VDRIGDNVKRELSRFGPAAGMAEVVASWAAAVGEAIAQNAWPARLARDGTLHVATSSSAWAFELGLLAAEISARLQDELGEMAPRGLRFAPGRLPEAPSGERERVVAARVRPSPADVARAVEIASSIEADDLRETVARAAAASLARAASDRQF
jgi:predicted nucleic acid-binding Zn ribbon protein